MSRKKFIQSVGATCANWAYAWSYVNRDEKLVIFGLWDTCTEGEYGILLDASWERDSNGRRKNGYKPSREHVRLVLEEGFGLSVFKMVAGERVNPNTGVTSARIESFEPKLIPKSLFVDGTSWKCAPIGSVTNVDVAPFPEDVLREGKKILTKSVAYERNPQAREFCLSHHGTACCVCGFDFGVTYGKHGSGYIHVHHLVPISDRGGEYEIDPVRDLRPVCPNCHAMIHRRGENLGIENLRDIMQSVSVEQKSAEWC